MHAPPRVGRCGCLPPTTHTHTHTHTDSVRAYKMRNKIGRFADPVAGQEEPDFKAEAEAIQVGDRCLVEQGGLGKRGLVKYVGLVNFKPGYWIGVQYDEPLGKHNGT
jgi:tubulin-folding cofactor B